LKLKLRERHHIFRTRRLYVSHKDYRTVAGHQITLDKKTVEHKLATIKPEPIDSVYVKVRKKEYPVKQVFAAATGLIRSQFSTKDAVRVLEWVGFDPKEKQKEKVE
jgi:UDP-3-O-acyl-N-acetylglucosamine deacetylase